MAILQARDPGGLDQSERSRRGEREQDSEYLRPDSEITATGVERKRKGSTIVRDTLNIFASDDTTWEQEEVGRKEQVSREMTWSLGQKCQRLVGETASPDKRRKEKEGMEEVFLAVAASPSEMLCLYIKHPFKKTNSW